MLDHRAVLNRDKMHAFWQLMDRFEQELHYENEMMKEEMEAAEEEGNFNEILVEKIIEKNIEKIEGENQNDDGQNGDLEDNSELPLN